MSTEVRVRAAWRGAAAFALLPLLIGCREAPAAQVFPKADRPVASIVSPRWSDENTRDRLQEFAKVMAFARIAPGMTVADIGAGEGYYTVRLSERVGAHGRVLAEDIMADARDRLARRVAHERLDNVSVRLGQPADPRLPSNSFDRVFMVHMYHEIESPYEFLWRLRPSLRQGGEVIVVDADRPTAQHGTPPLQLQCEFGAIGFRMTRLQRLEGNDAYVASFAIDRPRPAPQAIEVCKS